MTKGFLLNVLPLFILTACFFDESSQKSTMESLPAGCFQMGSNDFELNGKPVHEVCVSAFAIDKYEVTQGEYKLQMGSNPSFFSTCGDNCPVEQVNWAQANEYCQKLGKRLPTEAEWEYASKAGSTTLFYWGDDSSGATVAKYAWFRENSDSKTHPVGGKLPNTWGLYDMSGNVWEWTSDWYDKNYYSSSPIQDPKGPQEGSNRVNRGGSWYSFASSLRTANRNDNLADLKSSNLGFRCAK
jgi:sulfatase modifying factor 1